MHAKYSQQRRRQHLLAHDSPAPDAVGMEAVFTPQLHTRSIPLLAHRFPTPGSRLLRAHHGPKVLQVPPADPTAAHGHRHLPLHADQRRLHNARSLMRKSRFRSCCTSELASSCQQRAKLAWPFKTRECSLRSLMVVLLSCRLPDAQQSENADAGRGTICCVLTSPLVGTG